jgi:hypothetical protein
MEEQKKKNSNTNPLEELGGIYSTCKTYSLFRAKAKGKKVVSHNKVEA